MPRPRSRSRHLVPWSQHWYYVIVDNSPHFLSFYATLVEEANNTVCCVTVSCMYTEIIVAVFKSALNDVKRVLEELHQVTIHIDYFAVDDDVDGDGDDTGTADTLRLMHDKIKVSLLTESSKFLVKVLSSRRVSGTSVLKLHFRGQHVRDTELDIAGY